MLPPRFEQPAEFKWGEFKDAGGAKIRYGSLQPKGEPKGTIVLASGFREPIEKYFEVMRDLTERGYAVWMMDWHGQGGSDRYLANPQKMYSNGYEEHIATLHQFATDIVKKSSGPLVLMGHSMGAHISLRYLKEHEGVFDSAVLTSPMLDIRTAPFPRPLAKLLVNIAQKVRCLESYIPGAGDWKPGGDGVFAENLATSDEKRAGVLAEIFNANAKLIMGGVTYGWVMQTMKSNRILQDEAYLRSIKTPVLMGIAGDEKIVNAAASARAAGFLPNCTRVDIPAARHEIWMERDEFRAPWLLRVEAFLKERLGQSAPAPKKADIKRDNRPPGLG